MTGVKIFISIATIIGIMFFVKGFMDTKKLSHTYGTVIILNGPSSVGKSSIIKAFQGKQRDLWLSIGIDNFFVGVIPPKFYLEPKSEHYTVMEGVAGTDAAENKLFTLTVGQMGQKVIKGMHRAIAAYAKAGNNVIVDYIQYEQVWHTDLQKVLQGVNVVWVGVAAPLDVIEAREKKRGTSPVGHARSHYDSVHQGIQYDLMLDSDKITPEQSADKIIELLVKK